MRILGGILHISLSTHINWELYAEIYGDYNQLFGWDVFGYVEGEEGPHSLIDQYEDDL